MISNQQQQRNNSPTSKRDDIIPQLRLPDVSAATFYMICVNVFDIKETCPFIGEVEKVKSIHQKISISEKIATHYEETDIVSTFVIKIEET